MESLNTLSILGAAEADISAIDDCWNRIGVMGDRTCGELKTVIHCRNCSVYSAAGRSLLERTAPAEYLKEWTDVLAETSTEQVVGEGTLVRTTDTISVIIFHLGNERLALPVSFLQEVAPPCIIHTVPHRSDDLFLGILNIRGEILLCASLSHLLGLEPVVADADSAKPTNTRRLIVAGRDQSKWVFPVDEVDGIYRFHLNEFKETPVVVSKASEAYTKGVVTWQDKRVNFLNCELLFHTLNHKIF